MKEGIIQTRYLACACMAANKQELRTAAVKAWEKPLQEKTGSGDVCGFGKSHDRGVLPSICIHTSLLFKHDPPFLLKLLAYTSKHRFLCKCVMGTWRQGKRPRWL